MASSIITRYINESSVGGDGTTNNLAGTDAAYSTITDALNWAAANYSDMVAADVDIQFLTTGTFSSFVVSGYTMDATHRMYFVDNGNGTTYTTSGEYTTLIDTTGQYVDIKKSTLHSTNTIHRRALIQGSGYAEQCILISDATTQASNPCPVSLNRCTVVLNDVSGFAWSVDTEYKQCTIIAPNVTFTVSAFEVLSFVNTYFYLSAFTTATSRTTTLTNCLFEMSAITSDGDDVITDCLFSIAYNTSNFTDIASGSEVLSLPESSALIGVGLDNSTEYTVDIIDNDFITWDVGAYASTEELDISILRRRRMIS